MISKVDFVRKLLQGMFNMFRSKRKQRQLACAFVQGLASSQIPLI